MDMIRRGAGGRSDGRADARGRRRLGQRAERIPQPPAIRELVASWDRLGARRPSSKPWWQIKDRTDAKVLSVQTVLVSAMQTVVNKQYMLLRVRMDGHRLAEGLDDGQDGKSSGEAHIYACIDWAMTAARMMLWQMKALTEVDAQAARGVDDTRVGVGRNV